MYGVLRYSRTGLVYFTSKNECLYHYALYSLLRRPNFDHNPVHVEFIVNEVTMREVCLPVLQFFFVNNIPPPSAPHSYFY
jgi:hypothetical protein